MFPFSVEPQRRKKKLKHDLFANGDIKPQHSLIFLSFQRRASEMEEEAEADRERMDRLMRKEEALDEEELELERQARYEQWIQEISIDQFWKQW